MPHPSSSDDEAPESVSFNSQRKARKGEADALRHHRELQNKKQKEKNRARDRLLKERSSSSKNSRTVDAQADKDSDEGGEADSQRSTVEARIWRAILEAKDKNMEAESDREHESDDLAGENAEVDEDRADDANTESSDDNEDTDPPISKKPAYLPDHLFTAAFSHSTSQTSTVERSSAKESSPYSSRKKKRTRKSHKDIIIGFVLKPGECLVRDAHYFSALAKFVHLLRGNLLQTWLPLEGSISS